jgi:ATP-binding cassette subfamily B (MDR/TAP) protein 1
MRQDIGWHDHKDHQTHILTARLSTDTALVEGLLGSRLGLLIQNFVTIAAGVTIAMIYCWQLTLVILACSPVVIFSNMVRPLKLPLIFHSNLT